MRTSPTSTRAAEVSKEAEAFFRAAADLFDGSAEKTLQDVVDSGYAVDLS
jgi:hypothetical protein